MSRNLPTVHVKKGKHSMIVNLSDFEAGKFEGYEKVNKDKLPKDFDAKAIADKNVNDLKGSLDGLSLEQLDYVLNAEIEGKNRPSACDAIESAIEALKASE